MPTLTWTSSNYFGRSLISLEFCWSRMSSLNWSTTGQGCSFSLLSFGRVQVWLFCLPIPSQEPWMMFWSVILHICHITEHSHWNFVVEHVKSVLLWFFSSINHCDTLDVLLRRRTCRFWTVLLHPSSALQNWTIKVVLRLLLVAPYKYHL